jgi:hypothetical protein
MKNTALITIVFSAMSLTAVAAGIDGKWISDMEVGDADGKTYNLRSTIVLKSDGTALTGTITQTSEAPWAQSLNGKTIEISDGRIDGEKFSFKLKMETKTGERTALYEGSLKNDELDGIIKYRGIGMTRPFHAKRAS